MKVIHKGAAAIQERLGGCSRTLVYKAAKSGELETFHMGALLCTTEEKIIEYIELQFAKEKAA